VGSTHRHVWMNSYGMCTLQGLKLLLRLLVGDELWIQWNVYRGGLYRLVAAKTDSIVHSVPYDHKFAIISGIMKSCKSKSMFNNQLWLLPLITFTISTLFQFSLYRCHTAWVNISWIYTYAIMCKAYIQGMCLYNVCNSHACHIYVVELLAIFH